MNLSQIARLQALKKHLETFRKNHPKFPSFLNAVSHNALEEGTVIEISVTSPSDKNYVTNIKLRQDDLVPPFSAIVRSVLTKTGKPLSSR